jgi:hypothetical protein
VQPDSNARVGEISDAASADADQIAATKREVDALRDETLAALIEQETRPVSLVHNLITHWNSGTGSSERQSRAAKKAFFGALARYFVFSRALGAAGGLLGLVGGLVAAASLKSPRRTEGS